MNTNVAKPAKVAIIGAGPAGLSAAFGLTGPEVRHRFEVHVYQMGWRAGGKGLSPSAGASQGRRRRSLRAR